MGEGRSVACPKDNRFQSDTGPKNPISGDKNPIFIGSTRIARNPVSDVISDMRGGNTEIQTMVYATKRARIGFLLTPQAELSTFVPSQQARAGGVERRPLPARRKAYSYRILGLFCVNPISDSISDFSKLLTRFISSSCHRFQLSLNVSRLPRQI